MNKRKYQQYLPYILSFLIPVILMVIIFIGAGIWPFGDNCFLRTDLWHQYAPFFREYQAKLKQGGTLLYSFHLGLGSNFLALYAYYLSSPLNLFLFFCPSGYVIEFITSGIVFRMALASLFMTTYLIQHKRDLSENREMEAAAFGILYGMSGYMAAYSWNIMWLDCIALLPLVFLGIEKLVKKGKPFLYCISLALCIYSNYYIAIMICIGSCLWFLRSLICLKEFQKKAAQRILLFAAYSLLAGGLAAVMLVPEICALGQTASGSISFPQSVSVYFSLFDVLSRHLMDVKTEVGLSYWPNIYCGTIILLLVPLAFAVRSISAREKVCNLTLILLFLVSFSMNIPDFIWHGFHFPNSLPSRESFLYIFLILMLAYEGFCDLKNRSVRGFGAAWLLAAAFVILAETLSAETAAGYFGKESFYASIFLLTVYAGIGSIYLKTDISKEVSQQDLEEAEETAAFTNEEIREDEEVSAEKKASADAETSINKIISADEKVTSDKKAVKDMEAVFAERSKGGIRRPAAILLLVIISIEAAVNMAVTSVEISSRSWYTQYDETFQKLLDMTEKTDGGEFIRFMTPDNRTDNDGAWYQYNSVSIFSSMANSGVTDLYTKLGLEASTNAYSTTGMTWAASMLLGIQYTIETEAKEASSMYTELIEGDSAYVYKNTFCHPLGFTVDEELEEKWDLSSLIAADNWNQLAQAYGLSDLFVLQTDLTANESTCVTASLTDSGYTYLFVNRYGPGQVQASWNGKTKTFDNVSRGYFLDLGDLEAGTEILVKNASDDTRGIHLNVYVLDEKVLKQLYQKMTAQVFEIESMSDTKITGNVSGKGGTLVFTIPYDKGWTITVDGKEQEAGSFLGAFLSVDLEAGDHEICLTYRPSGLQTGLCLSVVSLLLCFLLFLSSVLQKRIGLRKKRVKESLKKIYKDRTHLQIRTRMKKKLTVCLWEQLAVRLLTVLLVLACLAGGGYYLVTCIRADGIWDRLQEASLREDKFLSDELLEEISAQPFEESDADYFLADYYDSLYMVWNRNRYYEERCGKAMEGFVQLTAEEYRLDNTALASSDNWKENYFYIVDGSAEGSFYYEFTCSEDGPVYLENNFRCGSIEIKSGKKTRTIKPESAGFYELGTYKEGERITMTVRLGHYQCGCYGLNLYQLADVK